MHDNLFVRNVSFAIRKRTFAATSLNARFGSTPALRGCHTIERSCDAGEGQPSARNGRSQGVLCQNLIYGRIGKLDCTPPIDGIKTW